MRSPIPGPGEATLPFDLPLRNEGGGRNLPAKTSPEEPALDLYANRNEGRAHPQPPLLPLLSNRPPEVSHQPLRQRGLNGLPGIFKYILLPPEAIHQPLTFRLSHHHLLHLAARGVGGSGPATERRSTTPRPCLAARPAPTTRRQMFSQAGPKQTEQVRPCLVAKPAPSSKGYVRWEANIGADPTRLYAGRRPESPPYGVGTPPSLVAIGHPTGSPPNAR